MRFSSLTIFTALIINWQESKQPQEEKQERPTNIDLASKGILKEINDYIKAQEWKKLVNFYKYLLETPDAATHLAQLYPDSENKSYVGLTEFMTKLFSKLPKEVMLEFKVTFDHKVAEAIDTFRAAPDKQDILRVEKLLELYFFSSYSDELMDVLASYYMEHGNSRRAIYHLKNILNYPHEDVAIAPALAKLALCYKLANKSDLIEDLKKYKEQMNEKVSMNGETITLEKYLDKIGRLKIDTNTILPLKNNINIKYSDESGFPEAQKKFNMNFSHCSRISGSLETDFNIAPIYIELDGKSCIIVQDGHKLQIIDINAGQVVNSTNIGEDDLKNPQTAQELGSLNAEYSQYGPFMTCQIEGSIVFANMYSSKLRLGEISTTSKRGLAAKRNPAPINSLHAFNCKTLEPIFSTDTAIIAERLKIKNKDATAAEFVRGDFSLSLPVIIQENRIYVGIISWLNDILDQSSFVACFEMEGKGKLKLRWSTPVSSRSLPGKWRSRGDYYSALSATFLLEREDVLYACTNTGSIAALDAYTGRIFWLYIYGKSQAENARVFSRPANYPILHKNHLYFLPMDEEEIVIIDTTTNRRVDSFKITGASDGCSWSNITHIQGIVNSPSNDFMVLSGSKGTIVYKLDNKNPSKSQEIATIPVSSALEVNDDFRIIAGHGTIVKDLVFLPTCDPRETGLKVVRAGPWETPDGSWKLVQNYHFKERKLYGNVAIVDNKMIIGTEEQLVVYQLNQQ